jgi:hypothetical protein
MIASSWLVDMRPCIGLIAGPVLWAVSTQLGLVWPWLECGSGHGIAALTSFVFACIAGATALVSWRSRALDRTGLMSYPRSTPFMAGLGSFTCAIFAFVLMLQGAADLVLDACQR